MSPPRPSVSPLSNERASAKASPVTQRISAHGQEEDTLAQSRRQALLDDDDDKSSSLSEPEDDDEEDEEEDEDEEATRLSNSIPAAIRTDDVDSEAETERLDQTPRKMRDGVDALGRTPSKLATVEHAEYELSDPPSPLPDDIGAASSTSTATGKKRKRSDTLESPLTSGDSSDGEAKRVRNSNAQEDADGEPQPVKGIKGKKGKPKKAGAQNKLAVEAVESVEVPDVAEDNEVEENAEVHVEEDPVRKSEAMDAFAQLAKQFTAFRETLFNERVAGIDAELALLLQPRCQHPEYMRMVACIEQRRQKQDRETRAYHHFKQISIRQRTLGERSQLHSQYFQVVRDVREHALDELGAEWYAIHRERRHGVNYRPDESAGQYQYADKRGDQLKQQAKYNHEVSILSGFAKYVGFPAAPEMDGVTGEALEDDLKAMKLVRRTHNAGHASHQHPSHHHHPHAHNTYTPRQTLPSAASSERIAHEKFIEQHAWARAPQYPTHHTPLAGTPNISHTPEWAGFRKPSNGTTRHDNDTMTRTAFSTPTGSRLQREGVEGNHERDLTESAGQSGPRLGITESSPLQVPKHRLNGADADGWRNYSGTSTIDAPLGESRDNEVHEPNPLNSSSTPYSRPSENNPADLLSTSHAPPPLFAHERPDMFRSAGFRPLDNSFAATTGSVQSRT